MMKRAIIFCALFLMVKYGLAQEENNLIHIIPQPVSVSVQDGQFVFNAKTRIFFNNDSAKQVAGLLTGKLNKNTGFRYTAHRSRRRSGTNNVSLNINKSVDTVLGDAGYLLEATPKGIVISANSSHGLFYGLQSLFQLLPPDIEADSINSAVSWSVPSVQIKDYPKFKWRGMMLDVSRHFFTKKEVEEFIDQMAKYKFNVFHWHLTDDQGWRIEINGLPKLTEVGAWHIPSFYPFRQETRPKPGEKQTYGGYYTQKDIREVIKYAKKRFVTILPEIDVPGHSLALIASYPNLSCTKEQYPIYPGDAPDTIDNALCVANDSTWLILDHIFTQVAALFPCEYIHVGGDEANRKFWSKDPKDIALMKREGIKSPAELQSYFEKKMETLIASKGKKMIGWDEILEGGLAPEATVMSWRGVSGGVKASQMGHHVIISPYGETYLSQLQGDPLIEPRGPAMTRLKKTYQTKILPNGIDPKWVLGGEACLWTEFVPNFRHAEYMTWPRALAAAEVFWGTKTSWPDFVRRTEAQFKYLNAAQVKYAPSMYDPIISAVKENDTLKAVLSTETPGLDIYYRFDGTDPDKYAPKYEGKPLLIPNGASEIRVITYKNEKKIGRQINCPVNVLKRRIRK